MAREGKVPNQPIDCNEENSPPISLGNGEKVEAVQALENLRNCEAAVPSGPTYP